MLLSEDQIYVKEVEHLYCLTPKLHKETTLYKLLEYENPASSMIFCNTKEETRQVYTFLLGKGLPVAMLSSDLPQRKREKVMARFKGGEIRHLVTTDVASRGIDIEDLSHVFIFSTPDSPEQYIHRAGRTGRVGKSGRAISLVSAHDLMNFNRLVKRYHVEVRELTRPLRRGGAGAQGGAHRDPPRRRGAEPPPRGLRGVLAHRATGGRARAPGPRSWPCSCASTSSRPPWRRTTSRPCPPRLPGTTGEASGTAAAGGRVEGSGGFLLRLPRPTLAEAFLVANLCLAALLGLLIYGLRAGSRQSVLSTSELVRSATAGFIGQRLQTYLEGADKIIDSVERQIRLGLSDPRDPSSVEAMLFALLLDHPGAGGVSLTQGRSLGFDAEGRMLLAPGGRSQLSVYRETTATDGPLVTVWVHSESGRYVREERRRPSGGSLRSASFVRVDDRERSHRAPRRL